MFANKPFSFLQFSEFPTDCCADQTPNCPNDSDKPIPAMEGDVWSFQFKTDILNLHVGICQNCSLIVYDAANLDYSTAGLDGNFEVRADMTIPNALVKGECYTVCFYILFFDGFTYIPIVLYCSNPIVIGEFCLNSSLIRYKSESTDVLGFDYSQTGFYNQIRLFFRLHSFQPKGERQVYQKSDGTTVKLTEWLTEEYELDTDFCNKRIHACLSTALAHDTFEIFEKTDFVGYVSKQDYNIKWTDNPLIFPYARAESKVTKANYLNYNRHCGVILLPVLPPCIDDLPLTNDADFVALINRMTVKPDLKRKKIIRSIIYKLKLAGIWQKLDCLWLLPAHHRQAARLNWINSAFDLTEMNWAATNYHVVDQGLNHSFSTFNNPAATPFYDTTFVDSLDGVQFSIGDSMIGKFDHFEAFNFAYTFGQGIGSANFPGNTWLLNVGNTNYSNINNPNGQLNSFTPSDFYQAVQLRTGFYEMVQNGVVAASFAQFGAPQPGYFGDFSLYWGLINNLGSPQVFSGAEQTNLTFAYIGASLSAQQHIEFREIISCYLNSVNPDYFFDKF